MLMAGSAFTSGGGVKVASVLAVSSWGLGFGFGGGVFS